MQLGPSYKSIGQPHCYSRVITLVCSFLETFVVRSRKLDADYISDTVRSSAERATFRLNLKGRVTASRGYVAR